MYLLVKAGVSVAAAVALSATCIVKKRDVVDNFFMGVFRDLGRIKAKKRRMGENGKAVSSLNVLFRRDDPLEDLDFELELEDDLVTYTKDELAEFGDGEGSNKLLISIFGRVYDVSAGEKFYGDGASYNLFVGHDITYALSTGCKKDECLSKGTEGLTEKQLKEGKRWLSFFQLHDKYAYVGKLDTEGEDWIIDILVESSLLEEEEMNETNSCNAEEREEKLLSSIES